MYKYFSSRSYADICDYMNENHISRQNLISFKDSDGWITVLYWHVDVEDDDD